MPSNTPAARVRTRRGPISATTLMASAALAVVAGGASMAVAQVSITPLPRPSGLMGYSSTSDDGRIVAGFQFPSGEFQVGPEYATIWTAETGLRICPDPTIRFSLERLDTPGSRGQTHFTSDGQYALAHRVTPVPGQSYERYRPVKVRLSDWSVIELPDSLDRAVGMSADGRTIVGNYVPGYGPPADPFVDVRSWSWREGQGVSDIVKPNAGIRVTHLSVDGRTMTGLVEGDVNVYRWRDGVSTVINGVGPWPAVQASYYRPSRNGAVAVSEIYSPNSFDNGVNAILHEDGTWEPLFPVEAPALGGYFVPQAITNAADRATFLLYRYDGGNSRTYVWDRSLGFLQFDRFLATFGIVVPVGVADFTALSMSPDGTTFIGSGPTASGFEQFHITIPSPGHLSVAGISLVIISRRRRS